jgi:hypothetical protein
MLADIRAKCVDFCGGSRKLVDECRDQSCRLWRHRKGLAGIQQAMFPAMDQLEGQIDMFERVVS